MAASTGGTELVRDHALPFSRRKVDTPSVGEVLMMIVSSMNVEPPFRRRSRAGTRFFCIFLVAFDFFWRKTSWRDLRMLSDGS